MAKTPFYLVLVAMLLVVAACETGNVQPECCPEPLGLLAWETYSIVDEPVNAIVPDQDGNIWLATPNGLHIWNGKAWNPSDLTQDLLRGTRTNDLLLWEDTLYLGSENGLSVFKAFWDTFIGPDSITSLALDPDGGLWAASQNAKLWRYDGTFYAVDNPSDPQYLITFVFEEENGRLWLGSVDGQIHIREAGVWRSENLGSVPSAISQNPNGVIWIGTRGSGAFLYKNGQLVDQFGQNEGALSNTINCLMFDERNRLWMGTDKGFNIISGLDTPDDILINFYDISDGLVSNHVQSFLILSETDWWIGTDKGISRRFVR